MVGDETKWVSGVIHPKVSDVGLLKLWNTHPEAGTRPDGELITNGEAFKIRYRTTWPLGDLKHSFLMTVQQVANLEADKSRRPKPDTRIEWSE
jgi:hypothetical protein